ncbi:MAG: hypothetical protein BMS9Abin15_0818 [Gammaproteobacteria bacterium]|nr:MAG: hypothetical protein BMS9Abin15_0818 [Gammaproteobacteria bacterium]
MSPAKKKATARKPTRKAVPKKKGATKKAQPKKKVAAKKAQPKKTLPKKKAVAKKAQLKKKVQPKKAPSKKTLPKKKAVAKKAPPKPRGKMPLKKSRTVAHAGITSYLLGFKPYKKSKGEQYMGQDMRAHFYAILNAWKQELMQEVDRTVHHMQDEAANFPDPNDRATQESEFSLELRTRDRERKLIKKIDKTLITLEQDEYGYCDSCGVEIGVKRLEARPTATLCIDCKTLDELKEKQLGI